jgi:hypothetical protein
MPTDSGEDIPAKLLQRLEELLALPLSDDQRGSRSRLDGAR